MIDPYSLKYIYVALFCKDLYKKHLSTRRIRKFLYCTTIEQVLFLFFSIRVVPADNSCLFTSVR